jgi:dihydroxyacetone kinase
VLKLKAKTEDIIKIVDLMAEVIIENEVYFCDLDGVAGDGDFGMSLSKGFRQIKAEWNELDKEDIGSFLKSCGMIITEYCGGASGPIWGSAFRAMAKYAKGKEELDAMEVGEMLAEAVAGIQKRGGAKLGDKTLLDALIPAAEAIKENSGLGMTEALKEGANAAVAGAEKTKEISASKGRATYVGDRSINHPDAGAMAIGVIFQEVCKRY